MWWGFVGIAAGVGHVLSGPDHLAAVAPFATHRRGLRAGAIWGVGHGMGVLTLGLIGVLFRGVVEMESLSAIGEQGVGFALICLGVWTLWKARGHEHAEAGSHAAVFGMGVLHGAAGASHLVSVFPTFVLAPADGALYLASFLLGACGAMALVASGLSRVQGVSPRHWRSFSGLVAIAVGVFWVSAGHGFPV